MSELNVKSEVVKGLLLLNQNGKKKKFLLLERPANDRNFKNTWNNPDGWDLPGGGVDWDKEETLEQAIHREIEEETGLKRVRILGLLWGERVRLTEYEDRIIYRVIAEFDGGLIQLSSEHISSNLVELSALSELNIPNDLKEAINEAFRTLDCSSSFEQDFLTLSYERRMKVLSKHFDNHPDSTIISFQFQ